MTPENTYKRIILDYMEKNRMRYRLSCRRGSNEVVVHGWPSMQGQGIDAAGYVAERWAKLVQFGRKHGIVVQRPGYP